MFVHTRHQTRKRLQYTHQATSWQCDLVTMLSDASLLRAALVHQREAKSVFTVLQRLQQQWSLNVQRLGNIWASLQVEMTFFLMVFHRPRPLMTSPIGL